jgi:hypothetical protein
MCWFRRGRKPGFFRTNRVFNYVRHKHYCPTVTFCVFVGSHVRLPIVRRGKATPTNWLSRHGMVRPICCRTSGPPRPAPSLPWRSSTSVGGCPWPIDLPLPHRSASIDRVLRTTPSESEHGGAAGRVLAPPFRGAGSSFSVGEPAKGVGRPECLAVSVSSKGNRPKGMGAVRAFLALMPEWDVRALDWSSGRVMDGTRTRRTSSLDTSQPRATTEQLVAHTKAPIGDWGSLLFVSGIDCGSLARA